VLSQIIFDVVEELALQSLHAQKERRLWQGLVFYDVAVGILVFEFFFAQVLFEGAKLLV